MKALCSSSDYNIQHVTSIQCNQWLTHESLLSNNKFFWQKLISFFCKVIKRVCCSSKQLDTVWVDLWVEQRNWQYISNKAKEKKNGDTGQVIVFFTLGYNHEYCSTNIRLFEMASAPFKCWNKASRIKSGHAKQMCYWNRHKTHLQINRKPLGRNFV